MRAGAHVEILPPGPASAMICEQCEIRDEYPRTAPAQAATREHNTTTHAYPEQPLDYTDPEEPRP